MADYVHDMAVGRKHLISARRVLVIGSSGAGKSTLSQAIAEKFDLDYISLDRDVRWLAGWKERDRLEQRQILTEMVAHDRWVMDGSGSSTFDLRLPRADLVIWLRLNRYLCLVGVCKRVASYCGTVRPDMAAGCPEPLPNREFLSYIWNFEKKHAPIFLQKLEKYGATLSVIVVKTRKQAAELLDLGHLPA